MNTSSFLQLLHLGDSALPVGMAAHSLGLESVVEEFRLEPSGLFSFFRAYLEEAGRFEAAFVFAGYDCASQKELQRLNDSLSAMKPARESREASLRCGRRLAQLAFEIFEIDSPYDLGDCHASLIFGRLGREAGATREETAAAYLHQSLSGLVSACQRLMPLGQSAAAGLLWKLKPFILEAVAAAAAMPVDELWLSQPLLDLASARHPYLSTRLFIS